MKLVKECLLNKERGISLLGILCGFFLFPTIVLAIDIEGTGIDWEVSTMQVEFTPENSVVPDFSCFDIATPSESLDGPCTAYGGPSDHCVWSDLDSLGYSDENSSPVIDNCFQQAGDYIVTVELTDFAENTSDPEVSTFTVKAGPPDQDQSVFELTNCAIDDENLNGFEEEVNVANGADVCTLLLKVRDQYGNPVTQLKSYASAKVYSDSDFPTDANRGVSFRDGLRLASTDLLGTSGSPTTFTLSNTDEVSEQFQLSAWAPSTNEVSAYLGKNEGVQLDLNVELPNILSDGTIDTNTANNITFQYEKYSPSVRFRPAARTILSFINNPEYIIDVETPMRLTRILNPTTTGTPPLNAPISSLLRTYLRYYNLPSALVFSTASEVYFDPPTSNFHDQYSTEVIDITPTLEIDAEDVQFTQLLSFATEVEYDTTAGTIRYPSGALGAGFGASSDDADDFDSTPVKVRLVGASIEGDILSAEPGSQIFADSEHLLLGGVNFRDIRESIFKNAANITRGVEVRTGSNLEFSAGWYGNSTVALVSGDVYITQSGGGNVTMPSGQNTLVIQNGNLYIENDMIYANATDSFGVILLNDELEPYPEKGNIFVRTNVKNVVGSYFAEGALISNDKINPNLNTTPTDHSNGLVTSDKQLLLQGTLLTHNTIGGAISTRPPEYDPGSGGNVGKAGYEPVCHNANQSNSKTIWIKETGNNAHRGHITSGKDILGLCVIVSEDESFTNPWGLSGADGEGTTSRERAVAYDLHYVRQFKPEYPSGGGAMTNSADCFSSPCDTNLNAFVIRVDGKAGSLPPPGFQNVADIRR